MDEIFNAVSNQTGVRVSLAPELAASIGTLDRLTIKAANVPAHLVLIHAAASVDLAVDLNADGAVVSKSDGTGPRVMVLPKKKGEGIDQEADVLRILEEARVEEAIDGEKAKKKVMVKVMRHPAADAAGGAPVIVESTGKVHVIGKDGAKTRFHVVGPGLEGAAGKRHLEIQTKGEDGSSTLGTLDIEVHSDETTM